MGYTIDELLALDLKTAYLDDLSILRKSLDIEFYNSTGEMKNKIDILQKKVYFIIQDMLD